MHAVEGTPSAVGAMLPLLTIVPLSSGYPGYGVAVLLRDEDHIGICKPQSPHDASYTMLRDMVLRVLAR